MVRRKRDELTRSQSQAPSSLLPALAMSPTLPQLPNEIIVDILLLSLPQRRPSTFVKRSALLRVFALLSFAWRPLAQAKLFTHLVIRDTRGARLLLRTFQDRPEWAERARSLSFCAALSKRGRVLLPSAQLRMREVLQACPAVQQLGIRGIRDVSIDWFIELPGACLKLLACSKTDLRAAAGLTKLIISDSWVVGQSHPHYRLPTLVHLSLRCVNITQSALPLLSPSALPSLRALALHAGMCDDEDVESNDIRDLVPQLEILSFDPVEHSPPLAGANDKMLLDVDASELRVPFSPYSHFLLYSHLRLRSTATGGDGVGDLLARAVQGLPDLKSLVLPLRTRKSGWHQRFLDACVERGVAVIYEERDDDDEDSLVSLAFWRERGGEC